MDDMLSSPNDLDPATFLQVQMDSHQELCLGPSIILTPASDNISRLQEVSDMFSSGDNLPGAEIIPIINPVDSSGSQLTENFQLDITSTSFKSDDNEMLQLTSDFFPDQIDDRRYECNICLHKFKRMDHLKRHMMTHTAEELYEAQISQPQDALPSISNDVIVLANEARRHVCNVCQYKFKRAEHLRRHMARAHPAEVALLAATEDLTKARKASSAQKDRKLKVERVKSDINSGGIVDEKKFACKLCSYRTKRRDHLNRHMTVHSDRIKLLKNADGDSDLGGDCIEMEGQSWSSVRRFSCTICDAKFRRADHLKRHIAGHVKTHPLFINDVGKKKVKSNQQENNSMEEVTIKEEIIDDEKVESMETSSSFTGMDNTSSSDVVTKKTDEEERRFGCEVCGYKFKRRYHLRRHMIQHTKKSNKSADNKNLSDVAASNTNIESVESEDLKQKNIFKCDVCDLEFKQPYRLKIHMARHSEERLHQCSLCDYRAKLPSNLKKHMLIHTDKKPFACHLCDYKGKLACSLKDHFMWVHSEDKPFSCEYCDFKAKVPSHLKKHMVSHQEEAPYKCPMCDFKAKRPGNLKEHMGTHTNEKRFFCNLCSYGSRRQRNLRKHMAIHFDEKPYSCHLCSYRAKLPHYLKDHLKTHMDVKPYSCPFCDYKSRQLRQLRRHIQLHADPYGVNTYDVTEEAGNNSPSDND